MEENENKPVGSWDNYLDNWLSCDEVSSVTEFFEVINSEEVEFKDKKRIRLTLKGDKGKFSFDLNFTNTKFLKDEGVKHPADLMGLKLSFRKVTVTNPSTKQEVEALRIGKVVGLVKNEKVGQ